MQGDKLAQAAHVSGDPFKESQYFELAEKSFDRHWNYYIEPIIGSNSFGTVIDLAVGHGRNTEKLRHRSKQVIGVDINQECIDVCRKRFQNSSNVDLLRTDGVQLDGISDDSIDLVFCFDAMVHFEPEVIEAYVCEFARVLRQGGLGLVHHSNWTNALAGDFQKQPHWRNFMCKELFGYFLHKNDLTIVSQKIIGWDESLPNAASMPGFVPSLDCISFFEKNAKPETRI